MVNDLDAAIESIIASGDPERAVRTTVRALVREDMLSGQAAGIIVATALAKRIQAMRARSWHGNR